MNRRGLLLGAAGLFVASSPAIVRAASLMVMPVRPRPKLPPGVELPKGMKTVPLVFRTFLPDGSVREQTIGVVITEGYEPPEPFIAAILSPRG